MFSTSSTIFLLSMNTILIFAKTLENKQNLIEDIILSEPNIKNVKIIGCLDQKFFFDCFSGLVQRDEKIFSLHYENLPTNLNKTIDRSWAHQTLFITDFEECPSLIENFKKIDKYFLEHPFHWLIFIKKEQIKVFKLISISLGSDIILALSNEETEEFQLVQGINDELNFYLYLNCCIGHV